MTLMNIYRRPGSLINQLNDEMNRLFSMTTGQSDVMADAGDWTPAVDIIEDDNCYRIQADVPGVKPEDIELEIEKGVLTITGKRDEKKEEEKEGYKRVERFYGQFYRRFTLPENVDAEAIEAKTEHGVLEVRLPKQARPEPKRIKVQS